MTRSRLKGKVGEMIMEAELLREKIGCLEAGVLLGERGDSLRAARDCAHVNKGYFREGIGDID